MYIIVLKQATIMPYKITTLDKGVKLKTRKGKQGNEKPRINLIKLEGLQ